MKKTLVVLAVGTAMIFAGCTAKTEPTKDQTSTETPVVTDLTAKTYVGDGLTFIYPDKYTLDEKGLWTSEGYDLHKNPPELCDTCQIPAVSLVAEETNKTLDQFVIEKYTLPEAATLEESANTASIPYSKMTLGENEFVKVVVSDMFTVTGYYTYKDGMIVGFETHADDGDNEELKNIVSSLKFK